MNRALLIVGAAILGVLVLAGGAYLLANNRSGQNTNASPTPLTEEQNGNFTGTFLELLELGQDQMCTFDNTDDEGVRTTGTAYVASGGSRLNADFTVHQTDGSFDGNIVRDGEYTYIWTTLQEQGVKIAMTSENESIFGDLAEGRNTGLGDDTEMEFDCSDWTADETMFVPPADAEFVDITETFSQLENLMGGQCSVCENLPEGEVRNQCLTALNCN